MSLDDLVAMLVPGRLVKLWCPFTKPRPKEKYYFIAAVRPYAIGFLANTNLTSLQQVRADLRDGQVKLPTGVLSYECYLDCTEAIQEFEFSEILDQVSGDVSRIRKLTPDAVIANVRTVVYSSLTIETGTKRIILSNLPDVSGA